MRVKFIIDRENEGAPVHYWEKFGASANWARLGANAALLIHTFLTLHKNTSTQPTKAKVKGTDAKEIPKHVIYCCYA